MAARPPSSADRAAPPQADEPARPARSVERLVFAEDEVERRRDRIAYLLALGAKRAAQRKRDLNDDDDHEHE